jgi:O-antigen/teichoic acid export membrane protein
MLKKLIFHSAVYGLAPSIPKIAGIFVLPVITKYLTDVDYGIAGTIAAYTGAISVFSTLGFDIVLTTSFYKHPYRYKWLWRQIYGFLQYWMIVFAAIQSIMLYFIIPAEARRINGKLFFTPIFPQYFIAYIGDDINDMELLKNAGISACPNSAPECVKKMVEKEFLGNLWK